MFALGHIYTNVTLGLFTNIAPLGSLKHIHISVPLFAEMFSPVLHHSVFTGSSLSGTHHPVLTRSSLSGTHHSVLTRSSLSGTHHLVLTGSSLPGTHIPSGGTKIPTISLFTSAWDIWSVRSASARVQGVGCQHLVSISDPFSSVWIFVSTNS